MSDIEIRAWYRGKMYYHVEYTTYEDGSSGVTGLMSKDEHPFAPTDSGVKGMLYTGRKDKKGQRIYEGDFLGNSLDASYVVVAWRRIDDCEYESDCYGFSVPQDVETEWYVKGNIYETPELLREDT